MGILVGALTDTLVVMAHVLPLSVAHNVAQSRLDKFLLQVFWENDLKTCNRDTWEVLVKHSEQFKEKTNYNHCFVFFALAISEATDLP